MHATVDERVMHALTRGHKQVRRTQLGADAHADRRCGAHCLPCNSRLGRRERSRKLWQAPAREDRIVAHDVEVLVHASCTADALDRFEKTISTVRLHSLEKPEYRLPIVERGTWKHRRDSINPSRVITAVAAL